jgi:hypothetical protein
MNLWNSLAQFANQDGTILAFFLALIGYIAGRAGNLLRFFKRTADGAALLDRSAQLREALTFSEYARQSMKKTIEDLRELLVLLDQRLVGLEKQLEMHQDNEQRLWADVCALRPWGSEAAELARALGAKVPDPPILHGDDPAELLASEESGASVFSGDK